MALICPAILVRTTTELVQQLNRCGSWASRIQIDLVDGHLPPATTPTVGLNQIGWPGHLQADLHLMYGRPADYLAQLESLRPNLVIIHPEADGDHQQLVEQLRARSIKTGLALRSSTRLLETKQLLASVDHALVFGGSLGQQGAQADLSQLALVAWLRERHPRLEIGWDGGINPSNVRQLVQAGVEVLYVGSYLTRAPDQLMAYENLAAAAAGDQIDESEGLV